MTAALPRPAPDHAPPSPDGILGAFVDYAVGLGLDRAQLATWLAACAIADGATIAYSPLLQARTRADEPHVPTETDQTFQRMLDALGASFAPQSAVIGAAGLVKAKAFANHANDRTPASLASSPRQRLEPVSP